MASKQSTVDFIMDQISSVAGVSVRKMFGEYAIFCDGRIVALICDNELFLKKTPAGKAIVGEIAEKPPYSGAKPCFLISGEKWEDSEWLSMLIRVSAAELPPPKKKKLKTPIGLNNF